MWLIVYVWPLDIVISYSFKHISRQFCRIRMSNQQTRVSANSCPLSWSVCLLLFIIAVFIYHQLFLFIPCCSYLSPAVLIYPLLFLYITWCATTFMLSSGNSQPNSFIEWRSSMTPTCFWSGSGSWFHLPFQLCFAKLQNLSYVNRKSTPAVMIGPWRCERCATSAPFSGISWNRSTK